MHELSVCQALLGQVATIARQRNAKDVALIVVRIGPLAGVVPELLKRAYSIAKHGTVAQNASLVIESLPVRVLCNQCGEETAARPNRLLCGRCGDWRTKVVSGEELLLASVELITQTPILDVA